MSLSVGSLFSGYGGLDLAVEQALSLPTETRWVSDIEPGPTRILAERFPNAPNLGDITTVDWAQVEPVDILIGGSPCQDLSTAGRRAGMMPGTRSGLWESMALAIETLRPKLVVWENVKGALSADAYCDMGWAEGLVDERTASQRPAKEKDKPLRALGRVLGDLTEIGYDAEWETLSAESVGATHQRERVFVVAYPYGQRPQGWVEPRSNGKEHTESWGGGVLLSERYGPALDRWAEVMGRPAPLPGTPNLNPAFVEWLMGLPRGWVTNVPISRTLQLRALGNGVVPQQAAEAIRNLLTSNNQRETE